eukprot:364509-Chlamydomonas_euryale.AAC.13
MPATASAMSRARTACKARALHSASAPVLTALTRLGLCYNTAVGLARCGASNSYIPRHGASNSRLLGRARSISQCRGGGGRGAQQRPAWVKRSNSCLPGRGGAGAQLAERSGTPMDEAMSHPPP